MQTVRHVSIGYFAHVSNGLTALVAAGIEENVSTTPDKMYFKAESFNIAYVRSVENAVIHY